MRRYETWALIDRGDHGMAEVRANKANYGLLEIDDRTVRWVPQDGEGWTVHAREITVLTLRTPWNRPSKGIVIHHPTIGRLRMRAQPFAPGVVAHPTQHFLGEARRTGKLRNKLIAAGAHADAFGRDAL